jgi:hypothetical protein
VNRKVSLRRLAGWPAAFFSFPALIDGNPKSYVEQVFSINSDRRCPDTAFGHCSLRKAGIVQQSGSILLISILSLGTIGAFNIPIKGFR